jgi:hypothetical protein
VKHLLYEEKYTIDGARKKLEEMRGGAKTDENLERILDRQTIQELRRELRDLLRILSPPDSAPGGGKGGEDENAAER